MELTHLKYFIRVAEELHFGQAAKKLNIAQPPLSQQIMRLEDELGVKLFHRTSRKVQLTDAGKIFYREAKSIIEHSVNAENMMRDLAKGKSGVLSIGFNEPAINTFLPSAIKTFIKLYPNIRLQLYELESAEQIVALQRGEINLAIMRPFNRNLAEYNTKLMVREKYVAAVSCLNPLAKKKKIRLQELNKQKLIIFPRKVQPELYDEIISSCRKFKYDPEIIQEAITKKTTLALVEAGLGIALVPSSSQYMSPVDIKFVPIVDELPVIDIVAVWRKNYPFTVLENFIGISDKICRAK